MIVSATKQLILKEDLSFKQAQEIMSTIMKGSYKSSQIAAYLTALKVKKESIDEISGSLAGMQEHALQLKHNLDVIDIVGTGGDNANTFNISTASAILAAACGIKVAKHGNRSASSKCGAADVLEAAGLKLDIDIKANERLLNTTNICFMYAPLYHPAMKNVASIRKELGFSTIFNILGPLANPAKAKKMLVGVANKSLIIPLAKVLQQQGLTRFMIVSSDDGLDEVSLVANTNVCEYKDNQFSIYQINPEDYGFNKCQIHDLKGGSISENVEILKEVLSSKKSIKQDVVVLNTAIALYIYGDVDSIEKGIEKARAILKANKGIEKLNEFIFKGEQL